MKITNIFKRKVSKVINEPMAMNELDKIIKSRMSIMDKEFMRGYNLIKKYPRSVSILGSARFTPDNIYYKQAESLARRIVKELNYAVVTGAGPGIMEAANKGAYEAGGMSLGIAIKLPREQVTNKYLTECAEFEYFFSRKTILFFSAETYIYYPGGYGTMDELFEILTLSQTGEIPPVPVVLVGREFWQPIVDAIGSELLAEKTIDKKDTLIYKIVDSEDEIIEIIKNAPFRQE
jgi:uncharacterized protein (TIGR00730 family)